MKKIAKTYRFNPFTLDKLEEIIDYWSEELKGDLLRTNRISATGMIEFLIIAEHMKIQKEKEEKMQREIKNNY